MEYCKDKFYDKRNWKIIKYKDFFKEGYKMKNFEKFKKEIADLLVNSGCTKEIDCKECENGKMCDLIKDNPDILEKWFFEEYKEPIKLTQFEYDLLIVHISCPYDDEDEMKDTKLSSSSYIIEGMKKEGYFKNVDLEMTLKEVLENCEVVE